MPKFNYKAVSYDGKLIKGSAIDIDLQNLETALFRKRLTLIEAKPVKERLLQQLTLSRDIKPRMIIELYFRISQTLDLGLPIIEALKENAKIVSSKYLKSVLEEIQIFIANGNTLAESMERFPKVFEKLDLAIVRMGEQSGVLPKCLKDLAEFIEWKENIRSTVKRAMIYPTIILLCVGLSLGVWVGYVLPQMETLLKNMGVHLPQITILVLGFSRFLQEWWAVVLGVLCLIPGGVYLYQKTPKGSVKCHEYILKIPIVGVLVANIAIARLSHNFATMYRAGISINQIFEVLSDNVLGNRYLEEKLKTAYKDVQRGESIGGAFERAGGFSELLIGAIRNGESTGTLDDSFERLGRFYDIEVKRSVETMINAMGPAAIVILGCIFGIILISILLPLYDVFGQIS